MSQPFGCIEKCVTPQDCAAFELGVVVNGPDAATTVAEWGQCQYPSVEAATLALSLAGQDLEGSEA